MFGEFGPCTRKNQVVLSEFRIKGGLLRLVAQRGLSPESEPRAQAGRESYTVVTSAYLEVFCFTCAGNVVFRGEDAGKVPLGRASHLRFLYISHIS